MADQETTSRNLVSRIAIVGAGLMGAQVGCEFALHGWQVSVLVRDAARTRDRLRRVLDMTERLGLYPSARVGAASDAMTAVGSIDELSDCALVIESLPEDMSLKVEVLSAVTSRLPAALVGTNTSSLSISALAERTGCPDRMVGIHYLNPPLLLAPVEVTPAAEVDPPRVEWLMEVLRRMSKRPVLVRREVPGLIWNRLQFAMLREAWWLVQNGVASTDDVDTVVAQGLAKRWRYTGPFRSAALGGPDLFESIATNLFPELGCERSGDGLAELLRAQDAEALESSRRTRDEGLAAELRKELAMGSRPVAD